MPSPTAPHADFARRLDLFRCWLAPLNRRRRLARGAIASMQNFERAILAHVAEANAAPEPFAWTRTARETLGGVAKSCSASDR